MTYRGLQWLIEDFDNFLRTSMTYRRLKWLIEDFSDLSITLITCWLLRGLIKDINDFLKTSMTYQRLQWLIKDFIDISKTVIKLGFENWNFGTKNYILQQCVLYKKNSFHQGNEEFWIFKSFFSFLSLDPELLA